MGVVGPFVVGSQSGCGVRNLQVSGTALERPAIEGESPVREDFVDSETAPEYRGTRETLWESGGTTLQG